MAGCRFSLLLLLSLVALASAGAVGPRRMLKYTLPTCTVVGAASGDCALNVAGITLAQTIPGPVPGTFVIANVQGYGFTEGCETTQLDKQIQAGAGGVTFDIDLSGRRKHYGHVKAHCADLYASAPNGNITTLTPCVNPDPATTYLTAGVLKEQAMQFGLPMAGVPVLLLFEVICGKAPVPGTGAVP